MTPLATLLDEATAALIRVDSASLERLQFHAEALLTASSTPTSPELIARFRLFASVLSGTGENCALLERLAGPEAASQRGPRWAR